VKLVQLSSPEYKNLKLKKKEEQSSSKSSFYVASAGRAGWIVRAGESGGIVAGPFERPRRFWVAGRGGGGDGGGGGFFEVFF